MFGKAKIINSGHKNPSTGKLILLAPVPIRAKDYIEGIQWENLGDPKQALARQESARTYHIYERFRAYLQPIRGEDNVTLFGVCFPPSAPAALKTGPLHPSALEAMKLNYRRNNGFPGKLDYLGRGDKEAFLNHDKTNDQANADSIQEPA
jgi:hypothetical protein